MVRVLPAQPVVLLHWRSEGNSAYNCPTRPIYGPVAGYLLSRHEILDKIPRDAIGALYEVNGLDINTNNIFPASMSLIQELQKEMIISNN